MRLSVIQLGGVLGSNEIWFINIYASRGTWTMTAGQVTTSPLNWNASADDVYTAMDSELSAGGVTTLSVPGGWTIEFDGSLAGQSVFTQSPVTVNGSGLA